MREYVQVHPILDFKSLQEEVLSLIPNEVDPVYGDYNVQPRHGWRSAWIAQNKPYYYAVKEMIDNACCRYSESWGCDGWKVNSMWYHVYNKGGSYTHHTHTLANMTGVIHLYLEDPRDYTRVTGYGKPVKEGEVILFPSMQPHRGDPVHAKKIVVGFNWDIYGKMKKYEPVQRGTK